MQQLDGLQSGLLALDKCFPSYWRPQSDYLSSVSLASFCNQSGSSLETPSGLQLCVSEINKLRHGSCLCVYIVVCIEVCVLRQKDRLTDRERYIIETQETERRYLMATWPFIQRHPRWSGGLCAWTVCVCVFVCCSHDWQMVRSQLKEIDKA